MPHLGDSKVSSFFPSQGILFLIINGKDRNYLYLQ